MSSVSLEMELMKPDVADSEPQQQQQQQQEQQEEEQHFHVLAVDDSLLDRKLLERLLRGSSYQVTCVESGDEALKYLGLVDDQNQNSTASSSSTSPHSSQVLEGSKVINLIMTDYCMPGMSGYDLLKRVKGSSWKNVPVVVMSSENVPSRISMCLEGGAEEFLLKPLQLSDLKKLQPYLLKSLEHHSCNDNNNNVVLNEVGGVDPVDQIKSTTCENTVKGNNNSNVIISKRKAVVAAQTISERRPKMEGLALVV
ncbi:two-component response regulator ORR4-like isoform X2 [Prunus avium]|uniref:Two-component response regulator ORR4-like isoform X2 n=1 Tax=Prunus avium TaxID=42229 RepID=A0A6P5RXV7_PRUAV|nr:two-component response regulator ORR4-like isoform X2 [Prunus avium]